MRSQSTKSLCPETWHKPPPLPPVQLLLGQQRNHPSIFIPLFSRTLIFHTFYAIIMWGCSVKETCWKELVTGEGSFHPWQHSKVTGVPWVTDEIIWRWLKDIHTTEGFITSLAWLWERLNAKGNSPHFIDWDGLGKNTLTENKESNTTSLPQEGGHSFSRHLFVSLSISHPSSVLCVFWNLI